MGSLNFVNLIQAGIITVGILGAVLIWRTKGKEFKGLALFLGLTAFASCINILEESGLTRDIYLISPVFIMLFGPAFYLAAKLIIDKGFKRTQLWHLFPVMPLLLFTSHTYAVIGIGTLWSLVYALLTASMLLKYKRSMDQQRSDSDDFSLNWLIWVFVITAMFNLVDFVRLNFQPSISYELNVLGQGMNNAVWLVAAMFIIIKLQTQETPPKNISNSNPVVAKDDSEIDDYSSLFEELDKLVITNKWYLKPRLTLNNLSDITGLQVRDISRAINLGSNKSFNEYINRYRVEFVCQSFDNKTQQSLFDVAADAGFSSKASFNKVFKQIVGVTPTEYRDSKVAD